MSLIRTKVTIEFSLHHQCGPLAGLAVPKTYEMIYDLSPTDRTLFPPRFADGMLEMPVDVNGSRLFVPLDRIVGVIKVTYTELDPSGVSEDAKEKIGEFCAAGKDGIPVKQIGQYPSDPVFLSEEKWDFEMLKIYEDHVKDRGSLMLQMVTNGLRQHDLELRKRLDVALANYEKLCGDRDVLRKQVVALGGGPVA